MLKHIFCRLAAAQGKMHVHCVVFCHAKHGCAKAQCQTRQRGRKQGHAPKGKTGGKRGHKHKPEHPARAHQQGVHQHKTQHGKKDNIGHIALDNLRIDRAVPVPAHHKPLHVRRKVLLH